jgi:hypothetical protein
VIQLTLHSLQYSSGGWGEPQKSLDPITWPESLPMVGSKYQTYHRSTWCSWLRTIHAPYLGVLLGTVNQMRKDFCILSEDNGPTNTYWKFSVRSIVTTFPGPVTEYFSFLRTQEERIFQAHTHTNTYTHIPGFTDCITSQIMEREHWNVANNSLHQCKTQATSEVHISWVSGCLGNWILHGDA